MRRTRRLLHLLPAACVALTLVAACAGPKQHAEQALADARAILAPIREEAVRYFPAELAAMEAQLASLDASLRQGDDGAVFDAVPALIDRLASLRRQALAARARANVELEMAKVEWSALAAELSERLTALDARVAELAAQRKLPPGLERAKFEAAKQALVAMKQSFKESATSETAGTAIDAVASARAVVEQAKSLAVTLGVGGETGRGDKKVSEPTRVVERAKVVEPAAKASEPAKVTEPAKATEPASAADPGSAADPAKPSEPAAISPAPPGP